ncbi:MAG: tetratricopeptide repeat protein [Planctomycetes bacterium]|nr:tetratricopeptide repeat protein [Planctomycetota bacterium]
MPCLPPTAIDQGLTGPSVFGGYGRALERKRNYDEAIGMYRKAIEADPLDPTFYMELADALRMKAPTGKDPEVKRLRRLALEIAKAMEHPAEYSILTSLTLEEYWEEEEKGQPKDAGSGK